MANWSRAALVAALMILTLGGASRAQYQSGYGTGPLSAAKAWGRVLDPDQTDYRAARAASVIAIRLFKNAAKEANYIEDVEPFYKYMRPMFAVNYRPTTDH